MTFWGRLAKIMKKIIILVYSDSIRSRNEKIMFTR